MNFIFANVLPDIMNIRAESLRTTLTQRYNFKVHKSINGIWFRPPTHEPLLALKT